jgi:hypothetical protein
VPAAQPTAQKSCRSACLLLGGVVRTPGSRCSRSPVGQIVTFFAYRPSSRPLGSLTPTQPGRVTNPTQGHPGPPWEAPQAECRSLRREPKQATGLAPGHATARALAQQHVPGNGCHLACIQGVPGGSSGAPVLSARDIYELGLSPLSVVVDDSNVEWQPCHCGRGSGHEQPGECSGDSLTIAMMVGGGGAPPLAAWLGPDWIRAPGRAPS